MYTFFRNIMRMQRYIGAYDSRQYDDALYNLRYFVQRISQTPFINRCRVNNFCKNGGICSNDSSVFKCICPHTHTSRDCSIPKTG